MAWCVPSLIYSGIVLLIDFIFRRKTWKENTKSEKTGLLLTLLFSFPYVFSSTYGALFGLETYGYGPFQKAIHTFVITGGFGISVVSIAATIASLILRKKGKSKASNWTLIIGFLYCALIVSASLIFD